MRTPGPQQWRELRPPRHLLPGRSGRTGWAPGSGGVALVLLGAQSVLGGDLPLSSVDVQDLRRDGDQAHADRQPMHLLHLLEPVPRVLALVGAGAPTDEPDRHRERTVAVPVGRRWDLQPVGRHQPERDAFGALHVLHAAACRRDLRAVAPGPGTDDAPRRGGGDRAPLRPLRLRRGVPGRPLAQRLRRRVWPSWCAGPWSGRRRRRDQTTLLGRPQQAVDVAGSR